MYEVVKISKCARCGMDHDGLRAFGFKSPISRGEVITPWRWTLCPETLDPLLIKPTSQDKTILYLRTRPVLNEFEKSQFIIMGALYKKESGQEPFDGNTATDGFVDYLESRSKAGEVRRAREAEKLTPTQKVLYYADRYTDCAAEFPNDPASCGELFELFSNACYDLKHANEKAKAHHCCYIDPKTQTPCTAPALYAAFWGQMETDYTEACGQHLFDLVIGMAPDGASVFTTHIE